MEVFMGKKIYVADDEKNIRELLKPFLDNAGYDTVVFENGDSLYETFLKTPCDLAVLDIMMPGRDGLEICTELRKITNIPIIILTARDSDIDYIQGISCGSDDYITKPFRPTQLLMKIHALFRRLEMDQTNKSAPVTTDFYSFGNLKYEPEPNKITIGDKEVKFTRTETKLLFLMLQSPNTAYSKEVLLSRVWDMTGLESRAVDETIRRTRKKLKESGSNVTIETVWGYGFRLRILNDE